MPSWRMNGLWRRMAGALMLCALLLSNEVMCQDELATDVPAANLNTLGPAADASPAPDATAADVTTSPAAGMASTLLPGSTKVPESNSDSQDEATTTKVAVSTINFLDEAFAEIIANQEAKNRGKNKGSSVFVGLLVTGLLAALAITIGYFKCQRRSEPKGVKLAEEAYPVDQENQGNTLVSVAPLNPPPETQEKPSINGESTEPAKTEPPPPPTNGHSTTKTADTEL